MCEPCPICSWDVALGGPNESANLWLIIDICAAVSTTIMVSLAYMVAGINKVWPTVGLNCVRLATGSVSCASRTCPLSRP